MKKSSDWDSGRRLSVAILTCLFLFVVCSTAAAQAASTGTITGRVLDSTTDNPLPGARVTVNGTTLATSTDRAGEFHLAAVPTGSRTIVASYLGFIDTEATVEINAVSPVSATLKLSPLQQRSETVNVSGLLVDAEARALNQQKTAPNISNVVSADQIGNFPDPNAAEATQRIPGISIQRDQGEGRYIIVRGTEPRLNSVMIDGERIPAPEADVRQVALDVIPADILQSIEVAKALTPDMDGDAIGGAVNLVMKEAPAHFLLAGSLGGGYNNSLSSYHQNTASVTFGHRFHADKVGLIVSASTSGTVRGNEDFEPVYSSGNLSDLSLRHYVVNRRRHGTTAGLDFRPSPGALYNVRTVYNYYIDDHEERQNFRQRVANRRLERELRDRTHVEHIWSAAFNGRQQFGRAAVDFHFSGAHSDQKDPLTITTTFRQNNVNFAPNVTPDSIDPDNVQANPLNENLAAYAFNQQVRATNFAGERDIVGGANLRLTRSLSPSFSSFFKVGVKLRDKQKTRTRDEFTLTNPTTPIPMSSLLLPDGLDNSLLDGRYAMGPYMSISAASALPSQYTMTSAINHARDSEDFEVGEQVASVYVMDELYIGKRWMALPGVRYEHTASDYTGNNVTFAPSGAWLATTPTNGSHNYGTVLPGVNVRYALNDSANIRGAITRTMARPNYKELVPYRSFDDSANTEALGNPDLRPTLSWNLDLMAEYYFKSIGLMSAGVFHKELRDYIYTFASTELINGETFNVRQSKNGDAASIAGLELALQRQLTFLPSPFDSIGVYTNYTFTDRGRFSRPYRREGDAPRPVAPRGQRVGLVRA